MKYMAVWGAYSGKGFTIPREGPYIRPIIVVLDSQGDGHKKPVPSPLLGASPAPIPAYTSGSHVGFPFPSLVPRPSGTVPPTDFLVQK